jgi:hypothetical protein
LNDEYILYLESLPKYLSDSIKESALDIELEIGSNSLSEDIKNIP